MSQFWNFTDRQMYGLAVAGSGLTSACDDSFRRKPVRKKVCERRFFIVVSAGVLTIISQKMANFTD